MIETTFLSVGLIHRKNEAKSEYLVAQKDTAFWTPVVARRLEKESFRESIIREIAWVLEMDRKKDFVVSNMAQLSKEYIEESESGHHHYAVAFYRARLYSSDARSRIKENHSVRWISTSELCSGRINEQTSAGNAAEKASRKMDEGSQIEPRIVGWINQWSVINPWD